jgi:hypothetical protein
MSVNRPIHRTCLALILAMGGLLWVPPVLAQDGDDAKYQLLFVQNSTSGTWDGSKLTLKNVGPTIFFTDRPQRVTGHMSTTHFMSQWGVGDDNFKADPPNAAFSIYSKDSLDTAVVEISKPIFEGTTLSYEATVLDGKLPAHFGESTLFIDILGRGAAFIGGAMVGSAVARANAQPQTVSEPTHTYTATPPASSPECTAAQNQLLAATTKEQVNLAEQKVRTICGS